MISCVAVLRSNLRAMLNGVCSRCTTREPKEKKAKELLRFEELGSYE